MALKRVLFSRNFFSSRVENNVAALKGAVFLFTVPVRPVHLHLLSHPRGPKLLPSAVERENTPWREALDITTD